MQRCDAALVGEAVRRRHDGAACLYPAVWRRSVRLLLRLGGADRVHADQLDGDLFGEQRGAPQRVVWWVGRCEGREGCGREQGGSQDVTV